MEASSGRSGADEAVTVGGALRRAISQRLLLVFVLGDILGAGIYALVGEVAGEVGGAIWTAFLLAFALAFFTAFAYAELVTKYPQAAGAARYTHRAFDLPFVTFMVAFAVMASGITSASTSARAFGGDYLSVFVELPVVVVAIGFLIVLALINFRGISESVKLNVGLTAVEVTGLLFVVAIGVVALVTGVGEPARALEFKPGASVPLAIIGGASLAFFALIGFEDSVNVAEETENPSRAYPRALFGGLVLAATIYLLVTFTAAMVVPANQLAGSSGALLEVVRQGPLGVPTQVFAIVALLALTNTALINMIMASRLVYGMSTQGIVPRPLARVHPRRRTPWVAIVFTTALGLVLVSIGELSTLADTTVLLLLAVFATVNVAVLVLRRDRVEHPHFVAPTAIPVVAFVVSVGLIGAKAGQEPATLLLAGALLALGAALWLVNRLVARQTGTIDPEPLEG